MLELSTRPGSDVGMGAWTHSGLSLIILFDTTNFNAAGGQLEKCPNQMEQLVRVKLRCRIGGHDNN